MLEKAYDKLILSLIVGTIVVPMFLLSLGLGLACIKHHPKKQEETAKHVVLHKKDESHV